ncbi:hypothetical protein HQ544_02155 [Candidatus Falkowbacteria bacterium]|nr:hypothetical protein [Candidatus Falkowbacteria bacterium]
MNLLGKIFDSLHLNFLNRDDSPSLKAKRDININPRSTKDAPNVSFKMTRSYIVAYPPDKSHFGELRTPVTQNCDVSKFEFLDKNSKPIGRCTDFQKLTSTDTELVGYYRIETRDDEKLFLSTLATNNGIITAKVVTTSGDQFMYSFEAVQGNWRKSIAGSLNLDDTFRLIKKTPIETTTNLDTKRSKELRIIKATYYDPAKGYSDDKDDVTEELSAKIKDGRLIYDGSYNDIFPDYYKRIKKRLRVEVEFNRKGCIQFYNEDDKINMPKDLDSANNKKRRFNINNTWLIAIGSGIIVMIIGLIFSGQLIPYIPNQTRQNQTGAGNNANDDIRLRRIESLEVGKRVSDLPNGIYFFQDGIDISFAVPINDLNEIKAKGVRRTGYFEIQKYNDQIYVIGFINTENYSKIGAASSDNPLNIVLFPIQHNEYTKSVSIPLRDIEEINHRYLDLEGLDILDVKTTKITGSPIVYEN